MNQQGDLSPGQDIAPPRRRDRPEHFSTYVPRDLIRGLKVIAAIRDVPLWAIVTHALEAYLHHFETEHGQLPSLATPDAANGRKEP